MKKILSRLHLWLSLPFGLIISLTCFSGAMLVFEEEATLWLQSERYKASYTPGVAPLPVDSLMNIIVRTLPDSVKATGITIEQDPTRCYKVGLSKPKRAAVLIDPYTGEIKGRTQRPAFFMTMFRLHRWLLDSVRPEGISWGKMIVGTSTLIFAFILLSGLVIWMPRHLRNLPSRLRIKTGRGLHSLLFSLHTAGGTFACIFLLAMALTGLTWSFGWYRTAFYAAFGAPQATEKKLAKADRPSRSHDKHERKGNEERGKREGSFRHWQRVYDQVAARHAGFARMTIKNGEVQISTPHFGNQRATDNYEWDERNGQLKAFTPASEAPKANKIRGWIFSIHVGNWGGIYSRILTFCMALFGGTLPLTGYYLWLSRKKRRNMRSVNS